MACLAGFSYFHLNSLAFFLEWGICSISRGGLSITLIFDNVSLLFAGFVCLIAASVLYYSGEYIVEDPHIDRFIYLVLLFVGSM